MLKGLLGNASIYVLANVLNAGIPFLLLPFLTDVLSTEDYGLLAVFQAILQFVQPFTGLNSEVSLSRYYFDKSFDYKVLLSGALKLILVSTLTLITLVWAVHFFYGFPNLGGYAWMVLLVIIGASQKTAEVLLITYRVQNKAIQFGLFRIINSLLDMGLSLLFVLSLSRGWHGRIEGQLLGNLFMAGIALLLLRYAGWIGKGVARKDFRALLSFGLPLIPHTIGSVLIFYSDRFFIQEMVGDSETGIYAVGYQIAMIVYLMQNSFNQAWSPWFFGEMEKGGVKEKRGIVKVSYIYTIVLIIGAWVLVEISPWLFEVFIGSDYQAGLIYVPWIAAAFVCNGVYKLMVNYLFFLKQTRGVGLITLLTALFNVAFNYILIKENGGIGAAQASLLAFGMQMLLIGWLAIRAVNMPWLFWKNEG